MVLRTASSGCDTKPGEPEGDGRRLWYHLETCTHGISRDKSGYPGISLDLGISRDIPGYPDLSLKILGYVSA